MEQEGAGKKILVVDDKKDSRVLISKILKYRGYEVIEAGTGEDAVTLAQNEFPDLILMDIRMPGEIDGLEATKRIKAIAQLAHIPIIAASASVKPEDRRRALREGCNGFIWKPIDIDKLPGQVAEFITCASSEDR